MPKKYIGKKFENNTWYHMYYDEDVKMMCLTEQDDEDIEYFYDPKREDIVAMAVDNELQKIVKARKEKKHRERIKKNIKEDLYVLLFAVLSGIAISKLSEPTVQYNIKYIITDEVNKDDLAIDYIGKAIDENSSISDEFKKYLLDFFNKLAELDYSFNSTSTNRILDNIKNKNFEFVSFDDQDSVVVGLAEVIKSQSDISVVMTSLEYYEHYNEMDASLKTRLFDAINARTGQELLNGIIERGDSYYNEYLCSKYGIMEDKANDIISFLDRAYVYVGNNFSEYENYINSILAFNYNFGSNYLHSLKEETTYSDLAIGNYKYSYNLFENTIKLTIDNGYCTYDEYFDTDLWANVTSAEYFNKFEKLVSDFDGNVDINNPNHRMLVYLYTLASLSDYQEENGKNTAYLFNLGESYFGKPFYAFLSGNEFSVDAVCSSIIDQVIFSELDNDDLTLLNETLVCLEKEKECGRIDPYLYELMLKELSIFINYNFDKETVLEWQDGVISSLEPENVNEIINKYRDKVSRLTKQEI